MSCSPLSYFTFEADCWIPEPPNNCVVGNPVFQQLYAEDSLQCTVQKETVLQHEEDEPTVESQDNSGVAR
ncbi:MAG: hypothetical protein AB4050_13430 [Synechococcus sp.]